MPIKRFFDGVSLSEVVLPDPPIPGTQRANDIHDYITEQNPTGVDPTLLRVDAAALPDLIPTQGAEVPPTRFPEPLAGSGEGPGVGNPSTNIQDVWANNPGRDYDLVETRQSGEIGSALPESIQTAQRGYDAHADDSNEANALTDPDRKVGGSTASPAPAPGETPDATWTKAQLGTYIVENGGTPPASSETKDVFLSAAQEVAAKEANA